MRNPTGNTNIRISLNADNVQATYHFDTYDDTDSMEITYLDRSENVAVTQRSYSGTAENRLYQCEAVEAISNLYNARVSYRIHLSKNMDGGFLPARVREHVHELASAIGLLSNFIGDNFQVPNENIVTSQIDEETISGYEVREGTVSELLDRLVGWSNDIPSMKYMCRITGNVLNVIQRSNLQKTADLSDAKIPIYPTFSERKLFTTWNSGGSNYIYSSDKSLTAKPFTGTIAYGGHSMTYEDGYLTQEEISKSDETATTTFTYTDIGEDKYLTKKTVTTRDSGNLIGKVETTYSYVQTTNEVYLSEENEIHYDDADIQEQHLRTTHVQIGNGWYGTTTYDVTNEMEILNTSMGQGAPGGKVNQYLVDAVQEGLGNGAALSERRASIAGVARLRATYPVYDISTLRKIANAIDAYNGSYEITAQLDVLKYESVIDIDTVVVLDNENWYVQSNEIEINPYRTVQHLNLIRWRTS